MNRRTPHAQHAAVLALALVTLVNTVALAQPTTEQLTALTTAQRRQADTSLSLREREQAMDRAIEIRAALIATAMPDDERLPGWLMEQAAATLARLAREGADTAVLLGIPLPAQREAVRAAATSAAAQLARAEQLLGPAEADIEGRYEQDRTVRIPFYRARAELLLARLVEDATRREHATKAGDLIGSLALTNIGAEATRRVNFGLARLLRASGAEDAQIALDEFAWVAMRQREPGDQGEISPITRAEAWLGLIHASAALGRSDALLDQFHQALERPPFVSQGTADPLLIVLAADAATTAIAHEALRKNDAALLGAAAREQSRLLQRTDLPMRAETLRPLIYEKLAILAVEAQRARPDLALPPEMNIARAVILARDPANRDAAIAILHDVRDAEVQGAFAADRLWELAVLLTSADAAPEDRTRAAALLLEIAERHPTHQRASAAMTAALAFARSTYMEAEPDTDLQRAARDLYDRALALATTTYPSLADINLWRYERARLLYESARAARNDADPLSLADSLAEALTVLEPAAGDTTIGADSEHLAERLHTLRLDLLWKPAHEARLRGAGRAASNLILPAARAAAAWARAADSPLLERFRLDLADALALAGGQSALDARKLYDEILPQLETPELRPLIPRARLGKARTLLTTEPAAAFALLRTTAQELEPRIAAAGAPAATPGEAPAPDPAAHELFWESWTLMLELVSAQASNPERQTQIRLHIRRLETLDANLGGPPWQPRIRATLNEH